MSDPLKRAQAVMQAKRAYILEVPGASDLLATIIASCKDASELRAFSELVTASGDRARFEVSIALAEGRAGDVRDALVTRTRAGDADALTALLGLAIQLRDREALSVCVAAGGAAARLPAASLFAALDAIAKQEVEQAVRVLAEVSADSDLGGWAEELFTQAFSIWTHADEPAWSSMATWLLEEARQTGDLEAQRALDAMQLDNGKPLLVAVLGEFNAGKSTFINAFVGADVAPTGILPTTATIHRLAFAPDPFARILIRKAPDRTIPHERLRETLRALEQEHALVDGVHIYAPIERLKWTEILDTPGFNSSNEEHDASARRALREAHAVIWLADATSPLKATEAAVLDEVRQAGLPVLLLVNKIDRLPAGSLEAVLTHLKEASRVGGAEGARLQLLSGPHPFSAKQALRGRLGNAEELAASRWSEVEEAITQHLIDSGDDLREAAHRRRLSRLIEAMAARAETEESKLLAERTSTIERARRLRSISSECELHRQTLAQELRRGVAEEWQLLTEDFKPLGALSREAADEVAVRSYLAERLTLHLAGPAIRWLTLRFESGEAPAALPLARASLTGVALASPSAPLGVSEADAERLLACVVRSFSTALDLLGQELLAKGDPWRRSRRLRAFGLAIRGERAPAIQVKADTNTHADASAQ
jgi:GTP-binding protein EngB required for normal cell division